MSRSRPVASERRALPPSAGRRGQDRRRDARALKASLAACAALILCAVAFYRSLHAELLRPRASQLLLDRNGAYLGEVPGEQEALGYWPPPDPLPSRIVVATLETEDRHFYEHDGVHPPSIARAVVQNLKARRVVSGASTLAMQVARMQSKPTQRSYFKKLREACEALLLVEQHGHEALLRQYLTIAPYGNRVRGVARASRLYFDKPVEDLSWRQAAFLAGLPQSPGRMDPWDEQGLVRANRRAGRILRQLHARGIITADELQQSEQSDLGLVPRPRRTPEALHAVLHWSRGLQQRVGPIVRATLDLPMQTKVAAILSRNLARNAANGAGNTAGIVVDPVTGEILAYVGSNDYFDSEARGSIDYVQTRRSPGSTLKPFIYALALQDGRHTAASELADTPMELTLGEGGAWAPENINHAFLGPMLLRDALGNSRNIPALRVLGEVGVERTVRFFEDAGVREVSWEPGAYGLGLAIGNLPVTLEELVAAYGVLASGGETLPLRRFMDEGPAVRGRLLARDAAQLVTQILSDPLARRPSFPAGSALDYPYAVAVKTGTSQGFRDAWTVGYSDRLIVGVWVGNHDWRRMNHVGGLNGAAEAVHEIFDVLTPLRTPHVAIPMRFAFPEGHLTREICPLSGRLAGPHCPSRRVEAFLPAVTPIEGCPFHVQVAVDARNGLRASESCEARFVRHKAMLDLPAGYHRWARKHRLELAPAEHSPLCPGGDAQHANVRITEPAHRARYVVDPDAPGELSTVRLSAEVSPSTEDIVWIVDGVPVAQVGYPHEFRWPLSPGVHTVTAAMVRSAEASAAITLIVKD